MLRGNSGGKIMGTICRDGFLIQGPIQFKLISRLSFSIKGNEHGHLIISGFLEEEIGSTEIYKDMEGQPLGVYTTLDGGSPIFVGKIQQLFVHQINRQYVAEAHVITFSVELDKKKKSRSFQNPDMTYAGLIQTVLQDTPGAAAVYSVGEDTPIGRPVFQYKETDWEFIKRMSSELNVKVFPARETPFAQINIGIEGSSTEVDLSNSEYVQRVDRQFYRLGGEQAGLYKADFHCYQVRDTRNLGIGCSVLWNGAPVYICGVTAELTGGEIIFTYLLGRKGLAAERPYKNRKMVGLSLGGTVKSTAQEQVVLLLDIDNGQDTGSYPFPWRPESGNIMYCMPKVGTRAALFLQDGDGSSAIALNSPRENGEDCTAMGDPSRRCFTTEHGKQLFLYPQSMGVVAGASDAPDQINLDQLNQLLLESAKAFQMISKFNIRIAAPTVKLQTPRNISVVRSADIVSKLNLIVPKGTASGNPPTGGGSTIVTLENQFNLKGSTETLWGTEFHTYPPFDDAPNEFDMCGWIGNMLLGALAVVVCVVAAIAFPAAAPFLIGAAIGAAVATAAISVADHHSGDVRNGFEAAKGTLFGAAIGATIAAVPYISSAVEAGASALLEFLPRLFPPLSGLPAMALAGGAGSTGTVTATAGGAAAIGGVIEQGLLGTGAMILMASGFMNGETPPNPGRQQPHGGAERKTTPEELAEKVPNKYKEKYKCKQFADELEKLLKENGISGERVTVRSKTDWIWSDKYGTISENGTHQAIKIGDKIFDNMNPQGISYTDWQMDLGISEAPYMFSEIIRPF